MLSALAKYIFGGVTADAPEPTEQYETREVNDWLLVNMPDQTDKDVDFDFDSDGEDADLELDSNPEDIVNVEDDLGDNYSYETEIVSEYESEGKLDFEDEDDDDILTALPLLLHQENDSDVVCSYPCTGISNSSRHNVETASSLLRRCFEEFQLLPDSLYLNNSLYYPADYSVFIARCFNRMSRIAQSSVNRSLFLTEDIKIHQRKFKPFHIKIAKANPELDKRENNPAAYSRNYINHRSPVLPPKTALLEQIKELKPAQRAAEYNLKRYISKSQLNRQNKNYIYESSVKINRRKNLQRHPSGANNNRKC